MDDDELLRIFLTLCERFGERVHAIRADQWALPTPNAAWNVAELVAHLITELRWVEPILAGLDLEAAADEVDKAGLFAPDDAATVYVGAWDEAAATSAAALCAPAALERTVSLWRGDVRASGYLRELIFELTIHAWDLNRAIAYEGPLPLDVVEVVWRESHKFGDLSSSGEFDKPVELPPDARVLDRLIAMTGRDPR